MPPWTKEDEAEAARSRDLGPMATIPIRLKTSSKDCNDDYDSGDDDLKLGLEVYDSYVDKTEAYIQAKGQGDGGNRQGH
jgi:hypothetical protein